jgi:hypothetical protein
MRAPQACSVAGKHHTAPAAGHYVLNLSSPVHQALANRLKDASSAAPEGPTWINILYDAYT